MMNGNEFGDMIVNAAIAIAIFFGVVGLVVGGLIVLVLR